MKSRTLPSAFDSTLRFIPADSRVLRSTSNESQERDNFIEALRAICPEQTVSRKPQWGRIASEANASGKAGGYADGGTARWKIEVQVGVDKS